MTTPSITIGVLALQGAFEEHQRCIESISPSITTLQIRTPSQLSQIDGIIFPGGESTAMGLIGDATTGLWGALRTFVRESGKPTWGTCAGMILLAERCVGTSAVITKGQSLIGGVDILVCRNYFGSQISSFEMDTPAPPRPEVCVDGMTSCSSAEEGENASFPGVFIRAPAILTAGAGVEVLGKVVAAPCRAAAVVLRELERKIEAGEDVIQMGVVDALERKAGGGIRYADVRLHKEGEQTANYEEEKKEVNVVQERINIDLPGASDETNAREVICAVKRGNILCTAFHPEIADDLRWHEYFVGMVLASKQSA
jgi:5'-phosphate synthase pdxT subunit